MKTTLISKEDNKAKFTLDFTAEEFESAVNKVYQKEKGQFAVDGFRRGKAPRSIIERRYGENVFFEDAINNLLNDNLPDAIRELELDTIDHPAVTAIDFNKGKPGSATLEVPVYPIIPVKDYFGVEVDELEYEVRPEDVDRELEYERQAVARLEEVDRPVENGDTVKLDFAGFVDGEQFEGGTAEDHELVIGSGRFIPGFEEQLIGAEKGSKVDVNVTFPEDYDEESLAGKDAVFHCTIKEIKAKQLPDLDDEFVKDISTEFDTLEELRADKEQKLRKALDEQAKNHAIEQLLQKVFEKNEYEAPAPLVERMIDNYLSNMSQNLAMQYGVSLEQYLQFMGQTMEDLRNENKDIAARSAAIGVILRSIGAAENITATDEEIDNELRPLAEQYKMDLESVKKAMEDGIPTIRRDIIIGKVRELLYDKAVVTKVKPPVPEKAAEETEEEPAEPKADAE